MAQIKAVENRIAALAYLRTSSAQNVGGYSDTRQREAIERFARANGYELAGEFYDAAVSGADPIESRPGFAAMLERIEAGAVRVVLVEDDSRFARSVIAQELGVLAMQARGVTVLTANGDNLTETDDPAKIMMRQIAGTFAQYEKARLVAKLKGARDRKSAVAGKRVEGRKSYLDTNPALVREGRRLARRNPVTHEARSLREVSAELAKLGYVNGKGQPFAATQVARLVSSVVEPASRAGRCLMRKPHAAAVAFAEQFRPDVEKLRSQGVISAGALAKAFNAAGHVTRQGCRWEDSAARLLLIRLGYPAKGHS